MNDGFINEQELRDYINNNNFNEYNENIKNFLKFSFNIRNNPTEQFSAIKCNQGQVKPDLAIKYKDAIKYVSIKKGCGNSVHQEKISMFFPYIESLFDNQHLNFLKKFHYGDDTLDDSGQTRFSASECQGRYAFEIDQLNKSFNDWNYLKQFLDRFLFLGNVSDSLYVDIVYHGTINNGLWASRDEIYNYFKSLTISSQTIHFGTLTYQVWGRNNDYKAVHPERRYVMQVKWGQLSNDLKKIRSGK